MYVNDMHLCMEQRKSLIKCFQGEFQRSQERQDETTKNNSTRAGKMGISAGQAQFCSNRGSSEFPPKKTILAKLRKLLFIHHSLNKHLFDTYDMPGTILSAGFIRRSKTQPCALEELAV